MGETVQAIPEPKASTPESVYPEFNAPPPRRSLSGVFVGLTRGARQLAAHLRTYRLELRERIARGAVLEVPWAKATIDLLNRAEEELAKGRRDEAWHCFMAAQRMELSALSKEERQHRRTLLLAESADKLEGWRRKSIQRLLHDETPSAIALAAALRLRDEHFENEFRKMAHIWEGFIAVSLVMLFLLGLIAGLDIWQPSVPPKEVSVAHLLLFGALGGAVSALRPIGKRKRQRLPEVLNMTFVNLMRPVLGTAGALAVHLFVAAGGVRFLEANLTQGHAALALAFASGFSERLLLSAVASFAGRPRRPARARVRSGLATSALALPESAALKAKQQDAS
ncbi:MAG TPA: hypothetical protein VK539_17890 [Myxococcaceae bacterium]|nr:hypothetical protein [Myxococcaceae bacterium]